MFPRCSRRHLPDVRPATPQREKRTENAGLGRDNEGVVAGVTKDASAGQAVRVRLLGEFAIMAGDRVAGPWPRPSARRLCALLLVSPGRRASRDLYAPGSGAMYRWVHLFPLIAVHLRSGELAKAVSAARQIIDPSQQLLATDLISAITGAADSWDEGDQAQTARCLAEALALARTRGYV